MFVELNDDSRKPTVTIMKVFRSDATQEMIVTFCEPTTLPYEVLQTFLERVHSWLNVE
jgi:hypothetical protein